MPCTVHAMSEHKKNAAFCPYEVALFVRRVAYVSRNTQHYLVSIYSEFRVFTVIYKLSF